MTTSTRAGAIPASAATAAIADASLAWRRAALWGLLGAKVVSSWGVQWDIQWHTVIGRDSFWIPPHVMTYAGVVVMVMLSFGVLAALILAGATLLIGLNFAMQPTFRFAYLHAGVLFHFYAMLAPLVLPIAFVAPARLSGRRWAPALVLVSTVALGLLGMRIARLGFDVLQPVSVIQEEIAKDPTSSIAVAYIVATKNGTPPGATASVAQLISLIPIADMIAVDPRRRPVRATVAYALVLFAVMAARLGSLPAYRPLVPDAGETLVALGIALVTGVVGGWMAGRLAALLGPAPPRTLTQLG